MDRTTKDAIKHAGLENAVPYMLKKFSAEMLNDNKTSETRRIYKQLVTNIRDYCNLKLDEYEEKFK